LLLPALNSGGLDTATVAAMTWALDYFPARDAGSQDNRRRARELRTAIEGALRAKHGSPPANLYRWVEIHGGEFQMGSSDGEGHEDERPRHPVTVSTFHMLAHEVTNQQLRAIFPDQEGPDDLPAVNVSWYQAYAFAAWLGEGGRLPTEAEWEYAARAGCTHDYCDRNGEATTLDRVAWHSGNFGQELHPVARKEPNPWGLYDLYGNAWEWVADWYGDDWPDAEDNPWGPPLGGYRVIRGGSAWLVAFWARAAYRYHWNPRFRVGDQGFRVVLPAVPER
jgi:formylglycine-generating enzyme required for sulfatase activity